MKTILSPEAVAAGSPKASLIFDFKARTDVESKSMSERERELPSLMRTLSDIVERTHARFVPLTNRRDKTCHCRL